MTYTAPPPTVEMIAQAELYSYDPNNTLGSLPIWDLRPDDTLAAAGLLHDLSYIEGGGTDDYESYDDKFERDCNILAGAVTSYLDREFEYGKAEVFNDLVRLFGPEFRHVDNWNSEAVQKQADLMKVDAKKWINECAVKNGVPIPYKEVVGC